MRVLSESCNDLIQYCRDIKENIFKHLTAIEGAVGSTVIYLLPSLFIGLITFIGTITGVILALQSITIPVILALQNTTIPVAMENIPKLDARALIPFILFIGVFASAILLLVKLYRESRKLTELYRNFIKARHEAMSRHVRKLEKCCDKLYTNGCGIDSRILCLDLEELEELTRRLERLLEEKPSRNLKRRIFLLLRKVKPL